MSRIAGSTSSVAQNALALALIGALASVACSADHPVTRPQRPAEPSSAARATAALTPPTDACPGTRWVGISSEDRCERAPITTDNGTFAASRLFSRPSGEDRLDPRRAKVLAGYCHYKWTPKGGPVFPGVTDFAQLRAALERDITNLERDCHVLGAAATYADDPQFWNVLRDNYRTMADRLGALPPTLGPAPKIRIATVDSSIKTIDGVGFGAYAHGLAVGTVAADLACPAGSPVCIGQSASYLTLSLVSPLEDREPNGGYFGTQTQLARNIADAVSDWYDDRLGPRKADRLVINLSVGWDSKPDFGGVPTPTGSDPSTWPLAVRSVYDALAHASCRGALVLAAAGNASSGPAPASGPMIPAAWESLNAPADCHRVETPEFDATAGPLPAIGAGTRPMLYAVGGVDGTDAPLGNVRPAGRPRLGAYGLAVTVDVAPIHTPPLTGSSMSTAIASGIAAATWGYDASRTAADIAKRIYDTGIELEDTADFCQGVVSGGGGCPDSIRRLSLCRAVNGCAGAVCAACATKGAGEGANPSWTIPWSAFKPAPPAVAAPAPCAACSLPGDKYESKVSRPWVDPQPGKGGCTSCVLTWSGNLAIAIDDDLFATKAIDSMFLSVTTNSGARVDYQLAVAPQSYSMSGIGASAGGLGGDANPTVSFLLVSPSGAKTAIADSITYSPD